MTPRTRSAPFPIFGRTARLAVGCLWFILGAEGTIFRGNLTIHGDWQSVAHFAVSPGGGSATGTVFVSHSSTLAVYDDDPDSWLALQRHHAVSCGQAVDLVPDRGYARLHLELPGGQTTPVSFSLPSKNRVSVWHFSIGRCQSSKGRRSLVGSVPRLTSYGLSRAHRNHAHRYHRYYAHRFHHLGAKVGPESAVGDVSINLHVTSNAQKGSMRSEFPADELALLPSTFIFAAAYSGMTAKLLLDQKRFARSVPDARMTSLLASQGVAVICGAAALSGLFSLVELWSFTRSGIERIDGVSFLRILAMLLEEVSRISTVLLLLLFGTGWMIVSPKLQDADCLMQMMWLLAVFYLIATLGTFLLATSPNFTDEYHGVLWLFVLVVESCVLLFAMSYAVLTLFWSPEKLTMGGTKAVRGHKGAENVKFQAELRRSTLQAVALLAIFVFLQDWLLALVSTFSVQGTRADTVFLVGGFTHIGVCAILAYLFSPWRCRVLQNTKAASPEAFTGMDCNPLACIRRANLRGGGGIMGAKARFYGEQDYDQEQAQSLMHEENDDYDDNDSEDIQDFGAQYDESNGAHDFPGYQEEEQNGDDLFIAHGTLGEDFGGGDDFDYDQEIDAIDAPDEVTI